MIIRNMYMLNLLSMPITIFQQILDCIFIQRCFQDWNTSIQLILFSLIFHFSWLNLCLLNFHTKNKLFHSFFISDLIFIFLHFLQLIICGTAPPFTKLVIIKSCKIIIQKYFIFYSLSVIHFKFCRKVFCFLFVDEK